MMTAAPDPLPAEPTTADFRRVAAIVTMNRYRVDPNSLWHQDGVAEKLWQARNTMPFPDLAVLAGAVARDAKYKGPGAIYLVAAGVIKP
ncbi:hypothetical protein HTS88_15615 [Pseudarthrobacter oxydans]|uniref:hypothetical protein n=1 Tax=Pseudarthrobacter oxydans TaxID=1671 RepID=UPI00157207CA|nr:hypothetical protein [Pseudarthrobacter oxydans]NSX37811.1 hypothetical protein [Pseudarthrobacter oxydans]